MADYLLLINNVMRMPIEHTLHTSDPLQGQRTLTVEILSVDASYRPALDDEVVVVEETGATSTTALAIGTGTRVLTIQAGVALIVGERVRLYSRATPTAWMEGKIASYVGTTLTVEVNVTSGTGTYADWVVARRRFGGLVVRKSERAHADALTAPIVTRIEAVGYDLYASRRVVNLTINTGTLKAALQQLEPYLSPYGVTLDPDQADGPTIQTFPLSFVTVREGLDQLAQRSGWFWRITPHKHLRMTSGSAETAPFNVAEGDGSTEDDVEVEPTREDYVNRVLLLYDNGSKLVEAPATPPPPNQLWEVILRADEVTDQGSAQQIADSYLAAHQVVPKVARYFTRRPGLRAGQLQSVSFPSRAFVNNALIHEVIARDDRLTELLYEVRVVESGTQVDDWRRTYERWSGGAAGGVTVGGGGGGGGGGGVRWIFLGGDMVSSVQSSVPTWTPASPFQVQIDTAQAGSLSAMVTAWVRAASGSVTVRLRNVSDNTIAGTSAVVTPPNWETWQRVTFAVTLTAGAKLYQVEVLPSLANTDVAAWAYLE
jgi:hypothetical protein